MRAQIEASLRHYIEPHLQCDLITAKAVKELRVDAGRITLTLALGFPCRSWRDDLRNSLQFLLQKIAGVVAVDIQIETTITAHAVQNGLRGLDAVKNIIVVASAKGGVGKSTTAVNLALALQAEGAQVGLLDADIYGPSQPMMLGVTQQPEVVAQQKIKPLLAHGLQTMSIGYLVDQTDAMIWRGPMVTRALQQLFVDTLWQDLDYLVIDLPPGTGDIQLTLAQKIPVAGAVIVTTPQDIALADARRGIKMFEKVKVPVLGVIENMSGYICDHCGHSNSIFGEGGGAKLAAAHQVRLLGQIPLTAAIRADTDSGRPTMVAAPESLAAKAYAKIALNTAAQLALQVKNQTIKFPKIVVESL